jgi:hypothetical protein
MHLTRETKVINDCKWSPTNEKEIKRATYHVTLCFDDTQDVAREIITQYETKLTSRNATLKTFENIKCILCAS